MIETKALPDVTDGKGNTLKIEEILPIPPNVYFRQFFGSFMTSDCSKAKCGIDIDKMISMFMELYRIDPDMHAAAMCLLEPAVLNLIKANVQNG